MVVHALDVLDKSRLLLNGGVDVLVTEDSGRHVVGDVYFLGFFMAWAVNERASDWVK